MKLNLYSVWTDPAFYVWAAVFAASLFFLVFSISKYLEITNNSDFDGEPEEPADLQGELPLAEAAAPAPAEAAAAAAAVQASPAAVPEAAAPARAPEAAPEVSRAEEFVKGLFQNMASLDNRMKNIEAVLAKTRVNREFTVTFLEDMLSDFDALSKEKIKVRIDYLLSDLKKQ